MNIKSCFLRWGIPLLLLAAFLAAVFALNRVDKVALVNREGQTFEKGVVVDILQDNLMPDGSRVGEQRVLVRMTTGVRAGQELETTSASGFLFGAGCTVGMKVVVIEDLISTGGSSLKAVEALRQHGCEVIGMVASYTYDFPVAEEAFKAANVELTTLTNYEAVVEVALQTGYIKEQHVELLHQWRSNPSEWGK